MVKKTFVVEVEYLPYIDGKECVGRNEIAEGVHSVLIQLIKSRDIFDYARVTVREDRVRQ